MAGDLFTSNFGAASPHNFSGEYRTDGDTYVTLTQNLDTGPGGRDYIRSTNQVTGAMGVQPYAGWAVPITAQAATASIFVRVYLRIGSGFNASSAGDIWSDKWIMLGDQGSAAEGDRMIAILSPRVGDTDCQLRVTKNIGDVPDEGTTDTNLTKGQWLSIQIEIKGGTGSAYIKLWIDNDTYASPTKQSSTFTWDVSTLDSAELGFFHNSTTGTGGNVVLDYAQFEVATTFDGSWHANQGAVPSSSGMVPFRR
jgi:hypothetical protein